MFIPFNPKTQTITYIPAFPDPRYQADWIKPQPIETSRILVEGLPITKIHPSGSVKQPEAMRPEDV